MKKKIYCLPYAGGDAAFIYKDWNSYLESSIDLIPLDLAGRGKRIAEPFYSNVPEAVEDLLEHLLPGIENETYALFGHSMGAMLAYELARRIEIEGLKQPEHLFFSGRGVPNIRPIGWKNFHLMNDLELKEEIMLLGGTPSDIFENDELKRFFMPLLKSDFCLAGTDFSTREVVPFNCDITVLLGKEEELSQERIEGWKYHTRGSCEIRFFEGGHFFIQERGKEIGQIIMEKLIINQETVIKNY